jgi:ADP-dependent NAD(P)H-hydrate dehydratase
MTDDAPITPSRLRQWPLPDPGGSKHSRGHALLIGGARATPGAMLLAGIAALRVGAGVLAMAVPDDVAVPLAVTMPEASVSGWGTATSIDAAVLEPLLERADAITIGPGIDDADVAKALVRHVSAADHSGPVLLDAYAIGVLGDPEDDEAKALAGRLVLTPNGSEAELLLDDDPGGRSDAECALAIADRWDAVVSYAGMVATVDGDVHEISTGHPGLGTSGSGDVLAGAIGGLLARGTDPVRAACWGTYLHAAAGDRLAARVGRLGFLARELLDELPLVLTELQA